MKIVHVTQYFQPLVGYQETFLARRQAQLGHEVTVVTSDRYILWPNYDAIYRPLLGDRIVGAIRRLEEGIDTWRLPTIEFQNHPWCPSLDQVLDALAPDAVHLHNIAHFMALSVLRHKRRGAQYRLVVDEHNTAQVMNAGLPHKIYRRGFRRFVSKSLSEYAHAVIGITTDSAVVSERIFGIDRARLGMIPLGSDHRHYAFTEKGRREIRERLGIPQESRVLIYTGKIHPIKRADALIEAMPRVLMDIPDAHLVIVGHPVKEYLDSLNGRISALDLRSRVHLCDAVPAMELPAWFSMADLACWPAEVTISMIDAASCSLPILAPRADGVEYQVSGDNGEFIRDQSLAPETLGGQIASLLGDPERLLRMGRNGRRLVEERLSWDAVCDAFMRLYEGAEPTGYDPEASTYGDNVVFPHGTHMRPPDSRHFMEAR